MYYARDCEHGSPLGGERLWWRRALRDPRCGPGVVMVVVVLLWWWFGGGLAVVEEGSEGPQVRLCCGDGGVAVVVVVWLCWTRALRDPMWGSGVVMVLWMWW